MKKFVIVGGGTAGWMAAMIIANQFKQEADVTLIESADVGIIGVGEGSTPALAMFFKTMNIAESEWMPACNATYKCGIRFDGWSGAGSSYFHPFPSRTDFMTQPVFFKHAQMRQQGADIALAPDAYYLANILAGCGLAPIANENFPFELQYGYHFDAGLLGGFLKEKSKQIGVNHIVGHVQDVIRDDAGNISVIKTKEAQTLSGDYFIDCTGFASLLLQQTLGVPFVSFDHCLFNNAAVTLPTEPDAVIPSETRSTAMSAGWAWKIPLTNRYGNGYVYADPFISKDQAETELRSHLGLLDSDVDARHLKMKVGRVAEHWSHNCLAVGLSQGFIEPLEATALFLVQQTLGLFVEALTRGDFSDQYRAPFNARVNGHFDSVRDYIVAHYQLGGRNDNDYWRASTEQPLTVSKEYQRFITHWRSGGSIEELLQQPEFGQYYPAISWYSLLIGLRHTRPVVEAPAHFKQKIAREQDETLEFLRRCALNFSDQREYLSRF